jgi:hypothetical protein
MKLRAQLLVLLAAAGCRAGTPTTAHHLPAFTQLALQPCRPIQVLGGGVVHIVGGRRSDQLSWGQMVTLGNGDGVLVSSDPDYNREVSWWSGRELRCLWRASLGREGASLVAGPDRVWLQTSYSQKQELWREVDADGRVHRQLPTPYSSVVLAGPGESMLYLTGDYDTHQLFRYGQARAILTLPHAHAKWALAIARQGLERIAFLATTYDQVHRSGGLDPGYEPRLIAPGALDVRLGEGPSGAGSLAALPDGGWLVALGPPSNEGKKIVVIRVAADGAIRWRTSSPALSHPYVVAVDPDGVIEIKASTPNWGKDQPRRLLVDLETGALRLADTARGRRWAVGEVDGWIVEGLRFDLDVWTPEYREPPCGTNRSGGSSTAVANALYVLAPVDATVK